MSCSPDACRQAREWQCDDAGGEHLVVSVNLSARQFARPDLAARVAAVLTETGLPPSSLELEITESVAMSDAEATGVTLRALNELGVRVVLDDFGTGYSSLAYLSQLPLDVIKVDRSFVVGMGGVAANLGIVRAVVGPRPGARDRGDRRGNRDSSSSTSCSSWAATGARDSCSRGR